jgi:uncharacterized membrane protein required for colicin V production
MSFPDTFYTIDVLFGIFVLLFGAAGMLRGLAGELARLITLTVLLAVSCFFYSQLCQMAARQWTALPPVAVQAITAVVLLLCAVLLFILLKAVLRHVLKQQVGVFFDRILGALLGMVFGGLIGLSVLCALSLLPQEKTYRMLSEKSAVGSWVCTRLTPWIYPRLLELPVFSSGELEVPAE